jgi:hypothetical protein
MEDLERVSPKYNSRAPKYEALPSDGKVYCVHRLFAVRKAVPVTGRGGP